MPILSVLITSGEGPQNSGLGPESRAQAKYESELRDQRALLPGPGHDEAGEEGEQAGHLHAAPRLHKAPQHDHAGHQQRAGVAVERPRWVHLVNMSLFSCTVSCLRGYWYQRPLAAKERRLRSRSGAAGDQTEQVHGAGGLLPDGSHVGGPGQEPSGSGSQILPHGRLLVV